MADQFVGEIRLFGFQFAPVEWAFCNGQSIPTSQNQVLYAIIATLYGGTSNLFNLPDLRGKAVIGQSGGPSNISGGSTTITLTATNIPAHTHTLYADTAHSTSGTLTGHLPGRFSNGNNNSFIPASPIPALTQLSPLAVSTVGSGLPHDNTQPYQVLNFCIALIGSWPENPN